jgi:hypothetical protein
MNAQARHPASIDTPDRGELEGWSAGDAIKADAVYRQLPRWSRQLFDLLSSASGGKVPHASVQASLATVGEAALGVDDACAWAAEFCAASGRSLPVRWETLVSGETAYWMEQPAAELFQGVITRHLA